jgi:hypothetical protein
MHSNTYDAFSLRININRQGNSNDGIDEACPSTHDTSRRQYILLRDAFIILIRIHYICIHKNNDHFSLFNE